MLANPKPGQRIYIWYRKELRGTMPLHGKSGMVLIAGRSRKLRNHLVRVEGRLYIMPCGNLNKDR